ncbi:MAG: M16 family metallopeptidase [bacterium]
MISRAHSRTFAAIALAALSSVAGAQQLDRGKRPAAGPAPAFSFPKYVTRTLPNGLTVAIVENHELPVVAVRGVIEGGGLVDPKGKEGVYSLMSAMLREGTASMSADELSEAFSDQGNGVNPTGFTTVVRNLDRSLELMADMVMHPSFPQAALDRQKANSIANVKRSRDVPQFVAQRLFATLLYGADHPYARSATEESFAAITRDDLVRFHDEFVRPQNVKLVIVGDVTPATVMPRVERAFGKWARGGTTISYQIPVPSAQAKTTIYLFDRPNSPQSVVTLGQVGPSRSVDDFYALEVMNTVFGQLSGSRLNQNLREKHAYTYGVNSFWQWRRSPEASTFTGSSSIVAPKTDSALIEWFRELRGIRGDRAVTDGELEFARTNRVAGMPATLESNDQVANAVVNILQNNLPADYYDQYVRRIGSITGAEITRVATKFVDPENTVIVIVGDRKIIEPGLKAANIGPVVIVDEKGQPVGG